eukprot:1153902_1
MDDLDTLHSELQSKLKEVSKIRDLLPYIEKTNTLEALKVQISARLQEQLTKEKKSLESSKPSPPPYKPAASADNAEHKTNTSDAKPAPDDQTTNQSSTTSP